MGADSIGNIAWAMFINDISHVPGGYDYQILINGQRIRLRDRRFDAGPVEGHDDR